MSVADLFGDLDTQQICGQSSQFLPVQAEGGFSRVFKLESLQSLTNDSRDLNAGSESQFLEIESLGADAIIYTGGAENYPEFFGSNFLPVTKTAGPAADSIEKLLSLEAIEQACDGRGVQRPRTIRSLDQMNHRECLNKAWLQKQIRSGGGLQTRRWDGETSIDFSAGEYLQEFIQGDTVSGTYISTNCADRRAALHLGACVQHPSLSENDFRYRGSVGPILLAEHDRHEMARIGQCIAEEFRLVGVFGIDFVRGSQGLCLVDINPRIAASAELIERSRRMNEPAFTIVRAHLDACLQNRLPKPIETSAHCLHSKTIIYLPAKQCLKIDARLIDYFQSHSYITDVPVLGSEIKPSHPLVTVHAEASDLTLLNVKSRQRIAELWKLMEGRLSFV